MTRKNKKPVKFLRMQRKNKSYAEYYVEMFHPVTGKSHKRLYVGTSNTVTLSNLKSAYRRVRDLRDYIIQLENEKTAKQSKAPVNKPEIKVAVVKEPIVVIKRPRKGKKYPEFYLELVDPATGKNQKRIYIGTTNTVTFARMRSAYRALRAYRRNKAIQAAIITQCDGYKVRHFENPVPCGQEVGGGQLSVPGPLGPRLTEAELKDLNSRFAVHYTELEKALDNVWDGLKVPLIAVVAFLILILWVNIVGW